MSTIEEPAAAVVADNATATAPGVVDDTVTEEQHVLVEDTAITTTTDEQTAIANAEEIPAAENTPVEDAPGVEKMETEDAIAEQMDTAVDAPNQEVEAPIQEVEAPNQEVEAPNQEVDAPNPEVDASNQEVDAPNQEVDAPNEEVDAPNQAVDAAPIAEGDAPAQEGEKSPVEETAPADAAQAAGGTFENKQEVYTACGVTAEESALNGNVARVHVKREDLEEQLSAKMDVAAATTPDLDSEEKQTDETEDQEEGQESEPVKIRKKPGRKRKYPDGPPPLQPKRPRGRPRLSDRPPPPVIERPPRVPSPPIVNGMKRRRKPNRLLQDFVDPESKESFTKDDEEEAQAQAREHTVPHPPRERPRFDDDDWTPVKRRYIKRSAQRDDELITFVPVGKTSGRSPSFAASPPLRRYYGRGKARADTDSDEMGSSSEEEEAARRSRWSGMQLETIDGRYVLIEDNKRAHHEEKQQRRYEFDFNKLVRYLKMVKLPAPNWKIRIVVSREQTISEVTFTNKMERERERCVKFTRTAQGHAILFGGKGVALVGAPAKINCENDITILLDVVHGIAADDPVLEYK